MVWRSKSMSKRTISKNFSAEKIEVLNSMLRITRCHYRESLYPWDRAHFLPAEWYFYCNPTPGGYFYSPGKAPQPFLTDRVYIFPRGCSFFTYSKQPISHFYIHFRIYDHITSPEQHFELPLEPQGTTTEENRFEKGFAIQNPIYGDEISQRMAYVPGGMGNDVSHFLTEYCFGDIYTRNGLDVQTRELLIYCILTALEADSQLASHAVGNMKLGTSRETLAAAVIQCLPYVGFPPAMKALNAIMNVQSETAKPSEQLVRLSKIVVDPERLDEYNAFLKEEIEASMHLEPGVLTLYATAEKERPNRVTILEIYADEQAYRSHLQTPHFQKYKQGTLDMMESLELVDSTPLIPGLKIK